MLNYESKEDLAGQACMRAKALTTMATLVGVQVLTRVVDDAQLSKEILAAIKTSLLTK
jgi:hypothetical protein